MTLRLFVVPISTRRALIYARLLRNDVSKERSILDRITDKAAQTWTQWEEADKGWKTHIVSWGNRVQQRIPYEEWGLKSIPSLSSQRRIDESHGTTRVDVLFPGNAIKKEKLIPMLHQLSKERQELHRRRMWWSFIAAPLTAPIALIPMYVFCNCRFACIKQIAYLTFAIIEYRISHSSTSYIGAGHIGEVGFPQIPVFASYLQLPSFERVQTFAVSRREESAKSDIIPRTSGTICETRLAHFRRDATRNPSCRDGRECREER